MFPLLKQGLAIVVVSASLLSEQSVRTTVAQSSGPHFDLKPLQQMTFRRSRLPSPEIKAQHFYDLRIAEPTPK
jgi:hypothetical protein